MAFSRTAGTERKIIQIDAFRREMLRRGWCQAMVPAKMLEELGIPFETESAFDSLTRYSPQALIYAPVWVYGVRLNVSAGARWDIVRALLVATRDDPREREVVSSELALNIEVTRSVRDAARNHVELMQKDRRRRENL